MNTPLNTEIRVLKDVMVINLEVSLWTGRRKLRAEDMGGADLPPAELATLGSKRIFDPERLKIFGTLKSRAVSLLERTGVRFMGGWALPEHRAGDVVRELLTIRDEFVAAKDDFLRDYDQAVQDWVARHAEWGGIIRDATASADYVRNQLGFSWQLYKVEPQLDHEDTDIAVHSGMLDAVHGMGGTLFSEIARSADETWRKVFAGKVEVTHRALSPLRTLHDKLVGLTLIEPRVAPVAELIATAIDRVPLKGGISGGNLAMLQGLVCLLRDTDALLGHAQGILDGRRADDILSVLGRPAGQGVAVQEPDFGAAEKTDEPEMPAMPVAEPVVQGDLASWGLW